MIDGVDLAVKTQLKSSVNRHGLSWMFQYGRYRKDTILDEPEAWVCFVQCNYRDRSYDCIIYPPLQIKNIVFSEPKLAKLKSEKKVVYAKDNALS
ncbi:MAG: hypothetical protein AAF383_29920 [Cyanobacteria bacterium P01_A01_bin.83]